MIKIKQNLVNKKLSVRVATAIVLYFILFFVLTILSHYLLPTEFLMSKNSVIDWETSNNLFTSTLQIFTYNLISVFVILFANLFAFSNKNKVFIPYGYLCLGVQFALNSITLGT